MYIWCTGRLNAYGIPCHQVMQRKQEVVAYLCRVSFQKKLSVIFLDTKHFGNLEAKNPDDDDESYAVPILINIVQLRNGSCFFDIYEPTIIIKNP